jgi:predicted MPP superfamily phosphohydrolase
MNPESSQWQYEKRRIWAVNRSYLETTSLKYKRYGGKRKRHWTLFVRFTHIFAVLLKIVNLYERGYCNVTNVVTNNVTFDFIDLPESFDAYRILHLTDLHLDCVDGIADIISERIEHLRYDLCVLTGDYRAHTHGGFKQILEPMRKITSAIKAKDGILAVLGNHDTYLMVHPLEKMGIKILANETITICRKKDEITVTGIDDPHYYYTDQAVNCLEEESTGFKIVLAHSPELYDVAADNDYNLYLCGHTHGGQICLPGGIPIFTHLHTGRRYYRGGWRYATMKGYTNQGCGAVAIPVRFNTQSEIGLVTLRKKVF